MQSLNKKSNKEQNRFKSVRVKSGKSQKGVSFFGFLFMGAIAIGIAILGMQIFPSASEYMAIKRAVKKASGGSADNPAEIRKSFDQYAAVDDIQSIKGTDLDVTKEGSDVVVSFKYEKKIPLFGPASLVLDYAGISKAGQ
jgi:Domain of unknown function (DUF4845)